MNYVLRFGLIAVAIVTLLSILIGLSAELNKIGLIIGWGVVLFGAAFEIYGLSVKRA